MEAAQRASDGTDQREDGGQAERGHQYTLLRAPEGGGEGVHFLTAPCCLRYSSRNRSAASKSSAGTAPPRIRGYADSAARRQSSLALASIGTTVSPERFMASTSRGPPSRIDCRSFAPASWAACSNCGRRSAGIFSQVSLRMTVAPASNC